MRLTIRWTVFVLLAILLTGCAAPRYERLPVRAAISDLRDHWYRDAPRRESRRGASWYRVRKLPMFDGSTGSPIIWRDLLDAIDWAQIIIVAEQHDDGVGHAVQRAVLEDVLARWPRSALSMEMLERDEQIIVDDFLEDIIDQDAFIRLTFSTNWGKEGKWVEWYQPIVDVAKDHSARIIAANAPRRYVRLARTDGYARLRLLPADRRAFFAFPRSRRLDAYRERFGEVMRNHATVDDDDDAADHDPALERRIAASFRSQVLWDATMAESIVRARPSREAKVVHLVGQFHSDFEGGLVQELRARMPMARILNISMQREWRSDMREEDHARADIIIYTGDRPPPEEDDEPEDEEPEAEVA